MADRGAIERHSVGRFFLPEHGIDRVQQRFGGAKRDVERHLDPALLYRDHARLEMPPHLDKGARVGALKAVDRLLRIADGENRANAILGAAAGEELGGKRGDDLPLLGIGVLRLVDQDMVEPAVELEQNPRRDPRPAQQFKRLQHEIVVIEQPKKPLAPLIGLQHRVADPRQRRRRLDEAMTGAVGNKTQHPRRLFLQHSRRVAGALSPPPFL